MAPSKTTIPRVDHFAQTIGARRDVRQNKGSLATRVGAFADLEFLVTDGLKMRRLATLNDRSRRFVRVQSPCKFGSCVRCAFNFEKNSLGGIDHPTFQIELSGQSINEGPKADALHRAANNYFKALALHV